MLSTEEGSRSIVIVYNSDIWGTRKKMDVSGCGLESDKYTEKEKLELKERLVFFTVVAKKELLSSVFDDTCYDTCVCVMI